MGGTTRAQTDAANNAAYARWEAQRNAMADNLSPQARAMLGGRDPRTLGIEELEQVGRAASYQNYYAAQGQEVSEEDARAMAQGSIQQQAATNEREAALKTPQAAAARMEYSRQVNRGVNRGGETDSFETVLNRNLNDPKMRGLTFEQVGRARQLGIAPRNDIGVASDSRELAVARASGGSSSSSNWMANFNRDVLRSQPADTREERAENAARTRYLAGDLLGAANASRKFGTGELADEYDRARGIGSQQVTIPLAAGSGGSSGSWVAAEYGGERGKYNQQLGEFVTDAGVGFSVLPSAVKPITPQKAVTGFKGIDSWAAMFGLKEQAVSGTRGNYNPITGAFIDERGMGSSTRDVVLVEPAVEGFRQTLFSGTGIVPVGGTAADYLYSREQPAQSRFERAADEEYVGRVREAEQIKADIRSFDKTNYDLGKEYSEFTKEYSVFKVADSDLARRVAQAEAGELSEYELGMLNADIDARNIRAKELEEWGNSITSQSDVLSARSKVLSNRAKAFGSAPAGLGAVGLASWYVGANDAASWVNYPILTHQWSGKSDDSGKRIASTPLGSYAVKYNSPDEANTAIQVWTERQVTSEAEQREQFKSKLKPITGDWVEAAQQAPNTVLLSLWTVANRPLEFGGGLAQKAYLGYTNVVTGSKVDTSWTGLEESMFQQARRSSRLLAEPKGEKWFSGWGALVADPLNPFENPSSIPNLAASEGMGYVATRGLGIVGTGIGALGAQANKIKVFKGASQFVGEMGSVAGGAARVVAKAPIVKQAIGLATPLVVFGAKNFNTITTGVFTGLEGYTRYKNLEATGASRENAFVLATGAAAGIPVMFKLFDVGAKAGATRNAELAAVRWSNEQGRAVEQQLFSTKSDSLVGYQPTDVPDEFLVESQSFGEKQLTGIDGKRGSASWSARERSLFNRAGEFQSNVDGEGVARFKLQFEGVGSASKQVAVTRNTGQVREMAFLEGDQLVGARRWSEIGNVDVGFGLSGNPQWDLRAIRYGGAPTSGVGSRTLGAQKYFDVDGFQAMGVYDASIVKTPSYTGLYNMPTGGQLGVRAGRPYYLGAGVSESKSISALKFDTRSLPKLVKSGNKYSSAYGYVDDFALRGSNLFDDGLRGVKVTGGRSRALSPSGGSTPMYNLELTTPLSSSMPAPFKGVRVSSGSTVSIYDTRLWDLDYIPKQFNQYGGLLKEGTKVSSYKGVTQAKVVSGGASFGKVQRSWNTALIYNMEGNLRPSDLVRNKRVGELFKVKTGSSLFEPSFYSSADDGFIVARGLNTPRAGRAGEVPIVSPNARSGGSMGFNANAGSRVVVLTPSAQAKIASQQQVARVTTTDVRKVMSMLTPAKQVALMPQQLRYASMARVLPALSLVKTASLSQTRTVAARQVMVMPSVGKVKFSTDYLIKTAPSPTRVKTMPVSLAKTMPSLGRYKYAEATAVKVGTIGKIKVGEVTAFKPAPIDPNPFKPYSPYPPVDIPPIGIPPFFAFPSFGYAALGSYGKRNRLKRPYSYSPSWFAKMTGVTVSGGAPSGEQVFTGFELRPMFTGARRKGSRAR